MRAAKVLFVLLLIAAAAVYIAYSIGTNNVGHENKTIIAPNEVTPGQLLRVEKNNLDSMVLQKLSDTVEVNPVY